MPKKALKARRQHALDMNLIQYARAFHEERRAARTWKEKDVMLLGTMPDTRLAKMRSRTRDEFRRERIRRKISHYSESLR